MIGYNRLGSNGRLGNQMFQYASLRGIAAARNYNWKIPPEDYQHKDNYGLFETFEMSNVKPENLGFVNGQNVQENNHCFAPEFLTDCPDDSNLEGYFQTEKYFKNVEKELREDFQFHDSIYNPCKEMIDSIEGDRKIFLHIRRGDPKLPWAYVNLETTHPVCTFDYYERALAEFPDDIPVVVFSDHIEWCKEQEFFAPDRFIMSESTEEFSDGQRLPWTDLCLMSLCTDAIIANSSFSWWGAWLQTNPYQQVIAPKKWFGPQYDHYHMDDLIPTGWKVM